MSELETLHPEQEIKTSQGLVELKPFKYKDFKKVLALVNKYFEVFANSENAGAIVQALMSNAGEDTVNDLNQLIYYASGKESEFLEELSWNEVANILVCVVEQNIDFFFQIGDRLNNLGKARNQTQNQGGDVQQLNSSNTDTSGQKSESTPLTNLTSS